MTEFVPQTKPPPKKASPMPTHDGRLIELLDEHRQQLFGFIFSLVHRITDAEDVFQQTSIELWKRFEQFEEGTNFIAWSFQIARCRAIDHLRAQQRDRHCFSDALLDELTTRQQQQAPLLALRAEALQQCRKKLSEKDRHMLEACYQTGRSIKASATTLGRTVGSVYTSLRRIRQALAECIERRLAQEFDQ